MKGARGTNCKSAKDRTSMSVTLEQSRLTYYNHIKSHVPKRPDKTTKSLSEEQQSVLWMEKVKLKLPSRELIDIASLVCLAAANGWIYCASAVNQVT